MHNCIVNFNYNYSFISLEGSSTKARQRTLARQMYDKLDLHPPDSTVTT